jgi:acyl carrier protein
MEQKLKELIAENMDVDVNDISRESNFVEDFGVDSLEMVELVVELEQQFGVLITNEELATVKTFGDLLAFVEKKSA